MTRTRDFRRRPGNDSDTRCALWAPALRGPGLRARGRHSAITVPGLRRRDSDERAAGTRARAGENGGGGPRRGPARRRRVLGAAVKKTSEEDVAPETQGLGEGLRVAGGAKAPAALLQ